MKKIIISLSIIGAIAAVVGGATIALFNDTETSTGNILVAGEMDLQVDHTWQTYNDVDCKTCEVKIISDTSNMVIARNDVPLNPIRSAVLVSNPHSRWTADVGNPDAKWIWATDPTLPEDTYGTSYTFTKTFDWYGLFTGSTLNFSVGSDNSVVVYLNGGEIGRNDGEFGYQTPISISFTPAQGMNELKFVVTNWDQSHNPADNPAGLKYALTINGNCGSDYFRAHCKLWGLKDLAPGDTFWNFDDIKPGDHGTNIISLHAYNNDAYACLITHDIVDNENTLTEPELALSDTMTIGELSPFIKIFVWEDTTQNNSYDAGEPVFLPANTPLTERVHFPLTESHTKYVGIAWCAGDQSVDLGTGVISCDGSSMGNIAQTDIMTASLTAYAEQQRNNGGFSCPNLQP